MRQASVIPLARLMKGKCKMNELKGFGARDYFASHDPRHSGRNARTHDPEGGDEMTSAAELSTGGKLSTGPRAGARDKEVKKDGDGVSKTIAPAMNYIDSAA